MCPLTVAFFLPGQHKWHHEYGLNFLLQILWEKDAWKLFSNEPSHFEFFFLWKRYSIFYPPWRNYLASANIQNFEFFVWDVSQQYEFYIQYLFCILKFNLKSIPISQGMFIFKFPVQHVHLKYQQYSHFWVVKGK